MIFLLTDNNSTFVFEGIQCGLSRISYAYLTRVAMWDMFFFRQRANKGITRSCMHWYVRKKYLTWVKTMETPVWWARKILAIISVKWGQKNPYVGNNPLVDIIDCNQTTSPLVYRYIYSQCGRIIGIIHWLTS